MLNKGLEIQLRRENLYMNKETFSFELVDKDKPEVVIKNSLQQIDEATRGYVSGKSEKYDGQI